MSKTSTKLMWMRKQPKQTYYTDETYYLGKLNQADTPSWLSVNSLLPSSASWYTERGPWLDELSTLYLNEYLRHGN